MMATPTRVLRVTQSQVNSLDDASLARAKLSYFNTILSHSQNLKGPKSGFYWDSEIQSFIESHKSVSSLNHVKEKISASKNSKERALLNKQKDDLSHVIKKSTKNIMKYLRPNHDSTSPHLSVRINREKIKNYTQVTLPVDPEDANVVVTVEKSFGMLLVFVKSFKKAQINARKLFDMSSLGYYGVTLFMAESFVTSVLKEVKKPDENEVTVATPSNLLGGTIEKSGNVASTPNDPPLTEKDSNSLDDANDSGDVVHAEGAGFAGEKTHAEGAGFAGEKTHADGAGFAGEKTHAEGAELKLVAKSSDIERANDSGDVDKATAKGAELKVVAKVADYERDYDDDSPGSEDNAYWGRKDCLSQFCSDMTGNMDQKKFKNVTISVWTHHFHDDRMTYRQAYLYKTHYHILQVSCNDTYFSLFRELISWPTSFRQVCDHLAVLFGDHGWPFTVSYFDKGKSFNSARYRMKPGCTNNDRQLFDGRTPFGFVENEHVGEAAYVLNVSYLQ
jgi:hypothetical protein